MTCRTLTLVAAYTIGIPLACALALTLAIAEWSTGIPVAHAALILSAATLAYMAVRYVRAARQETP